MEKKIKKVEVPFDFNWTFGVEIKKLKEDLDTLEKLGVTEIEIDAEDDGSPFVTIAAYTRREETDREFQDRVDKKNNFDKIIRDNELRLLKELKLKYEFN